MIVNSERYMAILRNFLQRRMEEIVEEDLGDVWFQQDGATARNSLNPMKEIFPGRLASLRDNVG